MKLVQIIARLWWLWCVGCIVGIPIAALGMAHSIGRAPMAGMDAGLTGVVMELFGSMIGGWMITVVSLLLLALAILVHIGNFVAQKLRST